MKKRLLCVFAHPGDESFAAGGTIAKYASLGWGIEIVVVATSVSSSGLIAADASIDPGKGELGRAMNVLGIQQVTFLDQPSGGLSAVSPGTIEDPLYKKMMEMMPDVVLTHDTMGLDNDPDHIKVCFSTTFAFQKYAGNLESLRNADESHGGRGKDWKKDAYMRAFGDVNPEDKEPKLYYACMPEHVVSYMQKMKVVSQESFGKPLTGTKDKYVTTAIDIESTKLQKGKALLCYESRKEEVVQFIDFDRNPLHMQEYFILRMQGKYEVFMGKTDRVAELF